MPAKTPDDYMREMMELYSRSSSGYEPKPPIKPVPEPVEPMPEPVKPVPEPVEPVPEPVPEPVEPMPEPVESVPEFVESVPEPVEPMPELILNPVPVQKPSAETPAETETSFGWIQVTARTAGNALPLEGVSVLILKKTGMDNELLMTLVTDSSGSTPKVRLPAPPVGDIPSQPYSTYEIRAFLPGYSRMESTSVPVFSGITSVQPFELIPLPEGSGNDQPAIINQNTEPKF
ncbi:MAG: carboxypeptidase-like regulatory domain-containing protein [Oscillospiraceae bacterium]|nr:carboxypeptidase-like regulatory domain-containing protein [Oscillospiraceae bacterium]